MSNRFSLNVAKLICPPEGSRNVRWEHYCKIELPWHLGKLGATERAMEIRDRWFLIGQWNFTLTEWIEEGHDVWDKSKLCGPDPMWIYEVEEYDPDSLNQPVYREPVASDPDYRPYDHGHDAGIHKPDADELRDYGPDYYPEAN